MRALDARFAWKGLALGVTGAQAMFNAVITLALSFIVFTFGSLLVAIQVAGGQYTPRIIATTLLRDNVIRYTAGLFVFTLLFAFKAADCSLGQADLNGFAQDNFPAIGEAGVALRQFQAAVRADEDRRFVMGH